MEPIYIDGDLSMLDAIRAFAAIGYHIRSDSAGRTVARRIPPFLMRDPGPVQDNVVKLKRRRA